LRLTGFDTKKFFRHFIKFREIEKKKICITNKKVDTTNAEGGINVVKKAIGNWKSIGPYF
jgi:hypothetical protein